MSSEKSKKVVSIGIRKENRDVWERRVALTPSNIKKLIEENPAKFKFIVQPSKVRIFQDHEYLEVGAEIKEDLTQCDIILGIREVPPDQIIPEKTYMFFGHVIKAQEHNMPMFDALLEKKVRFIDYEKITSNNDYRERLVYFGKIAGIAGTIDFLSGIGNLILKMGISTPLLNIGYSYKYENVEEAKEQIKKIAKKLEFEGIPEEISPFVIAITAKGRLSVGVMEILALLKHKIIPAEELPKLFENPNDPEHQKQIYITYILPQHMVQSNDDPNKPFDKQDYYKSPRHYNPIFHSKYLPYISAIINIMYWDDRFPRLINDIQMKELALVKKSRLLGVCDLSCDVEGSIQFLKKLTTPDKHFYTYDPIEGEILDDITYIPGRIIYQAIDANAAELAYDASVYFGERLSKFIVNLADSDPSAQPHLQGLIPELEKAQITWNGEPTESYRYILTLRSINLSLKANKYFTRSNLFQKKKLSSFVQVDLSGHLFDTHAINEIVDVLQVGKIPFNFLTVDIGARFEDVSKITLQFYDVTQDNFENLFAKIEEICKTKGVVINIE